MRRQLPSRQNSVATGIVAIALVLLVAPASASATVTHSIAAGTLVLDVSGDDPFIGCRQVRGFSVRGGPGPNTIDLSGIDVADFPDLGAVEVRGAGGDDTSRHRPCRRPPWRRPRRRHRRGPRRRPGAGGHDFDQLVWEEGDGNDVLDGEQGSDFVSMRGTSAAADSIRSHRRASASAWSAVGLRRSGSTSARPRHRRRGRARGATAWPLRRT